MHSPTVRPSSLTVESEHARLSKPSQNVVQKTDGTFASQEQHRVIWDDVPVGYSACCAKTFGLGPRGQIHHKQEGNSDILDGNLNILEGNSVIMRFVYENTLQRFSGEHAPTPSPLVLHAYGAH